MNYQLRDRRKKDGGIYKILGVFLLICLIYWIFGGLLTDVLHGSQKGVARFFGYYNDPVRPVSENSLIKDLKRENQSLKVLLGRAEEPEDVLATSTGTTTILEAKKVMNTPASGTVLGVILARPPRTPYDSLLIDIGEDEGLLVGDVVYGDREYVLGTIVEVQRGTSIVKLYSAPDQKIDVLVGDSTIPVVAEGRGSGNFYIKLPKNVTVTEGDQIIAPGIVGKVLGTAERIDSDPGEAYAHIYFRAPVNLYTLHYVQVKKNVR